MLAIGARVVVECREAAGGAADALAEPVVAIETVLSACTEVSLLYTCKVTVYFPLPVPLLTRVLEE